MYFYNLTYYEIVGITIVIILGASAAIGCVVYFIFKAITKWSKD